ncbi:MAG: transcription antitermination factor NusB, partial [Lysobacterales bacterium]
MAARSSENPRIAAARAVAEVLDNGSSLSDTRSLSQFGSRRDAALARHLAYEVLRWLTALQWLAAELLVKPLKKRDRDIGYLLLVGLQQLWHDRTASHAAVNETAECARLLGKSWAVPLLNAVLRRFQREETALLERLQHEEARFAHPRWLLQELRGDWPRQWQDIVSANNRQAPLWLRINRRRTDHETFAAVLAEAGFKVAFHGFAADAVSITPAVAVENIPGFSRGWFAVQDPAAQLARDIVNPRPGEKILDACAAPGGKAAHLLESCPQIELTALDKQEKRLQQVHQNLERLGLEA